MIEIQELERVVDEETDVHCNFEYYDRFDPAELRAKLGLDGAEGFQLSLREKGQIASRLYRNGFLSEGEVLSLGGKIKENNEI